MSRLHYFPLKRVCKYVSVFKSWSKWRCKLLSFHSALEKWLMNSLNRPLLGLLQHLPVAVEKKDCRLAGFTLGSLTLPTICLLVRYILFHGTLRLLTKCLATCKIGYRPFIILSIHNHFLVKFRIYNGNAHCQPAFFGVLPMQFSDLLRNSP